MRNRLIAGITAIVIAMGAMTVAGVADDEQAAMSGPSLEGTYKLVKRELPDGTVQTPPAVVGMMSLAHGYRNFNVAWKGPKGEDVSIGVISKYSFNGQEYSETNIFYMQNNLPGAAGAKYDFGTESAGSPVQKTDAGYSWKMPLHDEPMVTFTKTGMTATKAGAFTDYWEKVE